MAWLELGWRIGAALSGLIRAMGLIVALASATGGTLAMAVAVIWGAILVNTVVHEAGHYLAARALRQPVSAVHIYSPPSRLTFRLGGTQVHLGWRPGGRVVLGRPVAPGQKAIFTAAGPAASLLAALIVLALPLPGHAKYPLVVIFTASTLANLTPQRTPRGMLSDGASLLHALLLSRTDKAVRTLLADPAWPDQPGAARLLLRGIRLQAPSAGVHYGAIIRWLSQSGRTGDLLTLHRRELALPTAPSQEQVQWVHYDKWLAAIIPDLPKKDCELAERRLLWVLEHCDPDSRPGALHTLAVIRLRQGRPAEAEALCEQGLSAMPEPDSRATVLATIAMARHATGHSGRDALEEALALSPGADLVSEAAATLGADPARSP